LRRFAPYVGNSRREFLNCIQRREIRYADVSKRIPLPDRSVAVVYTSHMFDEIPPDKYSRFFGEVLRVLAPGGYIRIAVTDLRILAERYVARDVDADEFVRASGLARETAGTLLKRLLYLAFGPRGYRRWIYDGASLAALLRDFAFVDVVTMPSSQTSIPDPGALRLDERASETVYVEGRKPFRNAAT
jgi:SAM-dependent methyltransferase